MGNGLKVSLLNDNDKYTDDVMIDSQKVGVEKSCANSEENSIVTNLNINTHSSTEKEKCIPMDDGPEVSWLNDNDDCVDNEIKDTEEVGMEKPCVNHNASVHEITNVDVDNVVNSSCIESSNNLLGLFIKYNF